MATLILLLDGHHDQTVLATLKCKTDMLALLKRLGENILDDARGHISVKLGGPEKRCNDAVFCYTCQFLSFFLVG